MVRGVGGLYLEGLIHGGGYFPNFTVSFKLYCSIIKTILLYILPGLEKKRSSLKCELICKNCKRV